MIGNDKIICHVMPYVTDRNRMSMSVAINNEARYEMKRVMTLSIQ